MRIAYVSLIPDAGHLIPLLRIASAFNCEHTCKFFVAEEAKNLMQSSGFEVDLMPPVLPKDASQLLRKISGTSPLNRKIFFNQYFESHYYLPIQYNGIKALPSLSKKLAEYNPNLIITDEHLLGLAVHVAGHKLGINVLQHRSSGSNQKCQKRQPYAAPRSPLSEPLIYILSRVASKVYSVISRINNSKEFYENQHIKTEVNKNWSAIIKEKNELGNPIKIFTTGIAKIEDKYLRERIKICDNIKIFGALPPLLNQGLIAEVEQWLNSDLNKPVILVSLGSMVSIEDKFARSLLEAIKVNGCRVLWISKDTPIPREYQSDPNIRHVSWAPQPTLLADSRIKGFITHAGSGAVQEAFWFAKPMLCIPQVWDQPYNAWVVETLEVGRTINKKDFSTAIISQALASILQDEQLEANMKALSEELKHSDTLKKLKRYLFQNVSSSEQDHR